MTIDNQPVPDSSAPDSSAPTPVKSESVPPPSPPAQPSASPAPNAPAAFAEEPTQQPQPVDSNAPSPDPAQPTCSNCKTQTTPLWRRSEDGILCNACALYQKMKGCPRPVALKTDTIKHRNRSKGTKKDKAVPGKESPLPKPSKSAKSSTVRSSSTARKSQPGGADADDRGDDSYEEDSFASHNTKERSRSKRRKHDTPDSDNSPPPESMYPPNAILGEQAYRQYAAAHYGSRSSSADTRGGVPGARFRLQGRSPSQPAFPYNAALGYRPMYPPFEGYNQLQQQMAAHQGLPAYGIRRENVPHQQQPNWTEAMQQPVGRGVAGSSSNNSSGSNISLPPIRNLTEEIDSEARGRQRERMSLPAMSAGAAPLYAGAPAEQSIRNVSQTSSRASTVTGIPYSLGLSSGEGGPGLHDSSFPQSDSRRPHDTMSDSSSGSNSAGSPRSAFQSPYMAPTSASSLIASPGFGPLPDSAAAATGSSSTGFGSAAERRGRSVTRKIDNDIGTRVEALRMHDNYGSMSRSSSPRAASRPPHVSAGSQDGSEAYWRSSISRSRTSSPHIAADDEVNKLRMRVNELELINSLLVSRLTELEHPRRPSAAPSSSDRNSSVSRSFNSGLPPLPPPREDSQGELRATAAMDQG